MLGKVVLDLHSEIPDFTRRQPDRDIFGRLLGHHSVAFTLDTYADRCPDSSVPLLKLELPGYCRRSVVGDQ